MKIFYTAKSDNKKTGDIVTQWIGGTREESIKSCNGCPLLSSKICYAQFGTMAYFGHNKVIAHQHKKNYTLKHALKNRNINSKYVRFGGIGDPSVINKQIFIKHYNMVKKAGLRVLNYSHFWKTRGAWLKNYSLASCDTWKEVKQAIRKGWRATIHVEKEFLDKNGNKGIIDGAKWALCPFQSHGTQCNNCGLCEADRKDLIPIIVFRNH